MCICVYVDTALQSYKNDVNSNLSSTSMMTSPGSKTLIAPISSIQSTMGSLLDGIDLSGRILEWQLKNDNLFPSLFDQIKIGEGMNIVGYEYKLFVFIISFW